MHPEGSRAVLEAWVWSGCLYLRIQLGCFRRAINRATPPTERGRQTDRERQGRPRRPRGHQGALKKETSAILSLCREMQEPTLSSALFKWCLYLKLKWRHIWYVWVLRFFWGTRLYPLLAIKELNMLKCKCSFCTEKDTVVPARIH